MSWVIANWRLKLLSVVLAVGLLGGVAFSENPPMLDTVPVRVVYDNRPEGLVLVNPTTSVDVPVAGFRDDVQRYRRTTAGVRIDLSKAHAGANQVFMARPRQDLAGLTFRQSAIPITLTIEPLTARVLDIEVRTTNKAPGIATIQDKTYATCGNANDRCQVSVTGPSSVVGKLRAFVNYDVPITTAATGSSPNQPIQFDVDGHPIDLSQAPKTIPQIRWTPEVVTVLVTTEGGSQTKTVPVSVRVLGTQACGYTITGAESKPSQVTISGPVDTVSQIKNVTIDPVVLNGLTTTEVLVRPVLTGSTGVTADPPSVTVSVGLQQSFSCAAPSPSPTPAPSATPRPSPS